MDFRTQAFSRNIGWVTEAEQARLKNCRVAVGGLGGVGGNHAITLARLGIGRFTITDLDTFDWPNESPSRCLHQPWGKPNWTPWLRIWRTSTLKFNFT
ncbi:ThiF family adenylyltransferase [Roseateles sp. GG27B]